MAKPQLTIGKLKTALSRAIQQFRELSDIAHFISINFN
jgi:hypothetical protein